MTTSWSLHLTRHETGQERESTIAQTITEDPAVMAATLRAAADRLDPPQSVRPVYRRGASGPTEPVYRDRFFPNGWPADPVGSGVYAHDAQCRGNDCAEGHTYLPGCALEMPSMRALAERDLTVPLRDADSPNYAHDADCNTIHEAGPELCPPPRIATPAQIDAMVCPDCTDDEHTYERGKCALKPLRNGVVVDGDGKAPADPPYGG